MSVLGTWGRVQLSRDTSVKYAVVTCNVNVHSALVVITCIATLLKKEFITTA